jgi:MFS family permease
MPPLGFLTPEDRLDPARLRPGLRSLAIDHVFSQSMVALTGGAFMVALVLALGGDNKTIGLIAAIGPIAQSVQVPAIFLVQAVRRRRAITVLFAWVGRSIFLFIAAIPFVLPGPAHLPALLIAIAVHCVCGSIAGCAYGSWVRDVIPDRILGRYMGKRLAAAIGTGALASLLAGGLLSLEITRTTLGPVLPYALVFAVAGVLGMIGTWRLTAVPEPRMTGTAKVNPWVLLTGPVRHHKFRKVLAFLAGWAFAQNLAAPFFAVYLLSRLNLSLGVVVGLTVMTQLVNVALFPIWGALADRFSNKAVMGAAGLVFVLSFLAWPMMTLEHGTYWATWPLLIGVHLVMGVATAGVALSMGNLALKAAPRGEATAYLAANALFTGVGASVSPVLAGFIADYFADRTLRVDLSWMDPSLTEPFNIPAVDLVGLDFLFIIAFVVGLIALQRLGRVEERGDISELTVLAELRNALKRSAFSIAGPAGVSRIIAIPTGGAIHTARRLGRVMQTDLTPPRPTPRA